MPDFQDYAALYDFSQWEIAIQNFFCDATQGGGIFVSPPDNSDDTRENWQPQTGQCPFFTGFQSQVFQKQRPRIDLGPISYETFDNALVLDANNRKQNRAWNVPLEFFVITKADYFFHNDFLSNVRSIVAQMQPVATNEDFLTSGLNLFLKTHELAQITDAGGPSFGGKWTADSGYFLTPLKYNAIFAVRKTAWPGTNTTT